jgi:hypothetical protein
MVSISAPESPAIIASELHQKRINSHRISFVVFTIPTVLLLLMAYMTSVPLLRALGTLGSAAAAVTILQLHLVIYHWWYLDELLDTHVAMARMHRRRVRHHVWCTAMLLVATGAVSLLLAPRLNPLDGLVLFGFLVTYAAGNGFLVDRHIGKAKKWEAKLSVRESRIKLMVRRA